MIENTNSESVDTGLTNKVTSSIDEGLRSYLLGVYKIMSGGLAVTGLVAWYASVMLPQLMTGGWGIVFALLPLAFVFVLSAGIDRFSVTTAYALFFVFAATMGLSLGTLFVVYTGTSIAKALFISAGTFATFSAIGYSTKKDLSNLGGFLMMGLIGLIIASIINLFFASGLVSFVISCIAVLVFVGFTAYDTQQLKQEYLSNGSVYGFSSQERSSIYGALQLYLNFINIFVSILQLIGVRKD